MTIFFNLLKADESARLGQIVTAHSVIDTPVFMPVGTKATVKGILVDTLKDIGFQIILGNTYHLMLNPGESIVEQLGGLHDFMHWDRSILTDSGGFQVMSLSSLRRIHEDFVEFRAHTNGAYYSLSPELSVDIQYKLDANITMVLDECIPYGLERRYVEESTMRTTRWAQKSKIAFIDRDGYGIFAINQGGLYKDLRERSAYDLVNLDFDGFAIGGLAIGEPQDVMFEVLSFVNPLLPTNKPRYLMGVGRPADIFGAVELGVDMFDCVLPTRMGRNGRAFTSIGEINIRNAKYKVDDSALDPQCACQCCKFYSKAYLHHLFRSKEMLGGILLTIHNLSFYYDFMSKIRSSIRSGVFKNFKKDFLVQINSK